MVNTGINPARVDIDIWQGATFKTTVDFDQGDFTGYGARMQIRKDETSENPLVALTHLDSIAIDALNAKVTVTVPASITETLTATNAVYDLFLDKPGGDVVKILFGQVTIHKAITRD